MKFLKLFDIGQKRSCQGLVGFMTYSLETLFVLQTKILVKQQRNHTSLQNCPFLKQEKTPLSLTVCFGDLTFKPQAKPSANKAETITWLTSYLVVDSDDLNPLKVLKAI
jgi:hypothetical protein